MKTIYAVCEPEKVVLKEKELPASGPGQVLLKAKYSAMSPGTEKGLMVGAIVSLPTNIGYAMVAEVIEFGEGVEDLKVGDHVVTTGEHTQYLIMDETNCTPCPEGVDLRQAAFWNLGQTGCSRQCFLKYCCGAVNSLLCSFCTFDPVHVLFYLDESAYC